jgi:hypothetical protein
VRKFKFRSFYYTNFTRSKMGGIFLEVISQIFGYGQMSLWLIGMSLCLIEPVRAFTSAGLSFDYMLLNAFGFFCMAFQDQFGFWATASYSAEVHVSDLLLSFIGNLFCTFGIVIIFLIPSKYPNQISWMSMLPNGSALGKSSFILSLKKISIDYSLVIYLW